MDWEGQINDRVAVIAVIPRVVGAGHDRVSAVGNRIVVKQTAFYGVVTREGRIGIATGIGNRSGGDIGCQAASEGKADHEARGQSVIGDGDRGDSRALITA